MLKWLKNKILPQRKSEDEKELCLQDRTRRVQTWLYPVFANWELVKDILMWKTPVLSSFVFILISGVFWAFLLPLYQRISIAVGVILLFVAVQKDTRNYLWETVKQCLELEIKEENRFTKTPEEISRAIASTYCTLEDHIVFARELRHKSSSKFYCLLAVYSFLFLATWAFIPVARLLFITCCAFYFYPSMCYYGVVDKIKQKISKLSEPVVTHWENNLTKRQRNLIRVNSSSYDEDTDDEFALEKSKYNEQVLSAVLPDEGTSSQHELQSSAHDSLAGFEIPSYTSGYQDDFTDDEETRPSEFEHGLEMPSLSQFDSLMEPYDEFHFGLNFQDSNFSLSHSMNPGHPDGHDYGDLTDDDVEDIPLEDHVDYMEGNRRRQENPASGVRYRGKHVTQSAQKHLNLESLQANRRAEHNGSDSPRGVEKDYEFLDHSELDDPDGIPETEVNSRRGRYLGKVMSYSQASITQVSKWLGY